MAAQSVAGGHPWQGMVARLHFSYDHRSLSDRASPSGKALSDMTHSVGEASFVIAAMGCKG
jgi:hypothetical protein